VKVIRTILQNCGACGGHQPVMFKLDRPITPLLMETLRSLGFIESAHFTKAGILYFDTPNLNITGPIGSDKLTLKCKGPSDCETILNDFENLLTKIV